MHTHTYPQECTYASMTPSKHADERLLRLTIYTQICIHIHIHMYIHAYAYSYIYACIYLHIYMFAHTHTVAYAYTHTHIQHVHMHAHKHAWNHMITTALQRLCEKPNLMPRKLRTSPLEVVVPPPFDEIRLTRNDG